MQIIGKLRDGYIVTIETSELEMLEGSYYGHSNFELGSKIKVSAMFQQVDFLKRQEYELTKIKEYLLKTVKNLEVLTPIVCPDEIKDPS